ncbi:MAG: sigma-54-dependent transcriptional regulator [Gemmatimonadaceae bacterium]
MKQPKILLADDEKSITDGLSAILTDEGYTVEMVADGQKALERLSAGTFGVVLADLKMPKLDGLALLRELQKAEIATECIIITGQATVDSAVQSMRQGAYDYIEKPLNADKLNRLRALIAKALEKFAVQQKNRELASQIEDLTHYGELTGQSEPMRNVYRMIEAVAPSSASVLILGESGTGKELVARAMHSKSDRGKGPFLALNCAALPKDILENELFGHEKGAFTGSTNEKPGAFEMADGGTLFFDEVAEMSPDIQVKLLRALESRSVRRLGGKKEIPVDIRVLAATNKDLQKALADGDLRDDLYYRLAVVEIFLPPLRERVSDIKLLASDFLARFAAANGKQMNGFSDESWEWIVSYNWPGNVRELKNAVERAVIMARTENIEVSDVAPPRHMRAGAGVQPAGITLQIGASMAEARRELLLRTFASTGGDLGRTSELLGVPARDVRTELSGLLERRSGGGAGATGGVDASSNGSRGGRASPARATNPGKGAKAEGPKSAGRTKPKPKAKPKRKR